MDISKLKVLSKIEKLKLKKRMLKSLDELAEKNKHFTDEEINRDIEYAKKHAPRVN